MKKTPWKWKRTNYLWLIWVHWSTCKHLGGSLGLSQLPPTLNALSLSQLLRWCLTFKYLLCPGGGTVVPFFKPPATVSKENWFKKSLELLFSSYQGKVKQGISDTIFLSILNGPDGQKEACHLFSNHLCTDCVLLESGPETKTRCMSI